MVELHPQRPSGSQVVSIRNLDGTAPHPRRRYRVALNSYSVASAGGRLMQVRQIVAQPEATLEITSVDTREAVRSWAEQCRRITADSLAPPGFRVRPEVSSETPSVVDKPEPVQAP